MAAADLLSLFALVLGTSTCGILSYAVYNLYFHPLRHYPGPLLWRAFDAPRTSSQTRGRLTYDVLALHKKYGTVVRVAPNELAFAEPQAWQDIYGLQPGRVQNRKDPLSYPVNDGEGLDQHIIFAGDAHHARIRRLLGPAFTTAATKELAGLIERYADLLVAQLGKVADGEQVQDMSHWFEWTTFDAMGEFAFGEKFQCLAKNESHLFVRALFDGVISGSALGALERYKVWTVLRAILPKSAFKMMDDLNDMVTTLSKKRRERGHVPGEMDMANFLLQNKGDDEFTQKEFEGNALTLLFAGADTTATTLIFGSYLLCKNPAVMKRVQEEVRGRFQSSGEINATNANELKYMSAVLTEIMRLYPPGPTGLNRFIVNKAGQMVAGHHVPYNTSCGIHQLAANRIEANFTRPEEFLPERWFDDAPAEFAHDRREIYQPFSFGPRNCIGKPIAYMEMRVLMAKFLYNFTFELASNDDWVSTKLAYGAWDNSGLKLRLKKIVS